MRDPNRLYSFYNQLITIHVDKFPDLRFGQLIDIFKSWLANDKGIDIFYIEEDEFMKYFKEFSGWGDEYI